MRLRCHLTWLNHDQTSHQHICSNCQLDICHDFHENNIVHKTQRIKITRVGKKKRKKEKCFSQHCISVKCIFLQLHSVKVNVCQNKFKFCHHLFIPMSNRTQMTSSLKKYKKETFLTVHATFAYNDHELSSFKRTYIHTLPLKSYIFK